MTSSLATLVCAIGVLGLFYLDRDKSVRTCKALWVPVMWLLINGSRPVSAWFATAPTDASASQLIEGSPTDRLVSAILIAIGLVILLFRAEPAKRLLKKNWPILLYFFYCLVSLCWSDFALVGFKRWIKAVGDVVMVLIVLTDAQPIEALRRMITRVGFVLLPASVLMIKYFGELGRTYDVWSGEPANCGVTITKNMLGVLTFVITLGAFWLVLRSLRDKNQPDRKRHLIAQGTLLAFGISLLTMAHSATSGICFILGAILITITSFEGFRRRPAAIHGFVLAMLLMAVLTVLVGNEAVAHAVGRETTLTGRTEIWQMLIPMAPNAMVGAGFESFWLGPRLERIWSNYAGSGLFLNEAHNGYLEVYLNLGLLGVALIVFVLFNGYRNAVKALRKEKGYGPNCLLLAYILTAVFYSLTEAGFREMYIIWIFLLLAILGSSDPSVWTLKSSQDLGEEQRVPQPAPAWRRVSLLTSPRHG